MFTALSQQQTVLQSRATDTGASERASVVSSATLRQGRSREGVFFDIVCFKECLSHSTVGRHSHM